MKQNIKVAKECLASAVCFRKMSCNADEIKVTRSLLMGVQQHDMVHDMEEEGGRRMVNFSP